jgi:hypothetical protein
MITKRMTVCVKSQMKVARRPPAMTLDMVSHGTLCQPLLLAEMSIPVRALIAAT